MKVEIDNVEIPIGVCYIHTLLSTDILKILPIDIRKE